MTAPAAAAAAAAATTTAAAARPAVAGTKAWTQASHAAISWCNKPSSGAQCGVPCSMSKACQNNPSAGGDKGGRLSWGGLRRAGDEDGKLSMAAWAERPTYAGDCVPVRVRAGPCCD